MHYFFGILKFTIYILCETFCTFQVNIDSELLSKVVTIRRDIPNAEFLEVQMQEQKQGLTWAWVQNDGCLLAMASLGSPELVGP